MWRLCGKGHQGSEEPTNEKMEKKGSWFIAVKKALNSGSKDKSNQKRKKRQSDPNSIIPESESTTPLPTPPPPPSVPTPTTTLPQPLPPPIRAPATSSPPPPPPPIPKSKPKPSVPPPQVSHQPAISSDAENERTKHALTLAAATARAAEAAVAAAQAAAEVVRLTTAKSKQEVAAIKIQTAFRGYLARRALRILRGLKRLQTMMQGQAIKRQTTNTLKTMQTLARMQSEMHERRMKMAEENLARQKLIQQKQAKEQARLELEKSHKNEDDWDSRIITKEQIEAKLQNRQEAAIRRERTLAYSYTHQHPWKAVARSGSTLYMDQNNPHWGWSWMERWLATRPWETMAMPDKDSSNNKSPRNKGLRFTLPKNEVTKSYSRFHNTEKPPPTSVPKQARSSTGRLSTSSAPSKSVVSSPVVARKLRSQTPKASRRASMWSQDEDAKSTVSMRSGNSRRNSCSSAKDDNESLASSQTVPTYMAPTESAKARSRSVTPDRTSVSSLKKRSSCTPSPARSRRSTSSVADVNSL